MIFGIFCINTLFRGMGKETQLYNPTSLLECDKDFFVFYNIVANIFSVFFARSAKIHLKYFNVMGVKVLLSNLFIWISLILFIIIMKSKMRLLFRIPIAIFITLLILSIGAIYELYPNLEKIQDGLEGNQEIIIR